MSRDDFTFRIETEPGTDSSFGGGALAERAHIVAYLEARAAKVERCGGKASARQLRVAAGNIAAGLRREDGDG